MSRWSVIYYYYVQKSFLKPYSPWMKADSTNSSIKASRKQEQSLKRSVSKILNDPSEWYKEFKLLEIQNANACIKRTWLSRSEPKDTPKIISSKNSPTSSSSLFPSLSDFDKWYLSNKQPHHILPNKEISLSTLIIDVNRFTNQNEALNAAGPASHLAS